MNALTLFKSQKRFDLIFKYMYIRRPSDFTKTAYLENIRAFNGFFEQSPSDGIPKNSSEDYLKSFNFLIDNISTKGFDDTAGLIPIGKNGEISDGAHRLSVCAYKELDIPVINDDNTEWYPYSYFRGKGMDESIMDYGALEYVKLNHNAYIVILHSVTNLNREELVLDILNQYGFVYYSKEIKLTYNGYVNLKKISYGSFWESDNQWIGNEANRFLGAQEHAKKSIGTSKKPIIKVFVFVCDRLENVKIAKNEIRAIYNVGNYSVHINDNHEEAVCLAETFFNENTLFWLNTAPFWKHESDFDKRVDNLKKRVMESNCQLDSICCVGSTPLNIFSCRRSDDLDFLSNDPHPLMEDNEISSHDSQLKYYKHKKEDIIENPQYHFYYHGVKFISLEELLRFKKTRKEFPKDIRDLFIIINILKKKIIFSFIKKIWKWLPPQKQ